MDKYFRIIESEIDKSFVPLLDLSIKTSARNMAPIEFKIYKTVDNEYKAVAYREFTTPDMVVGFKEQVRKKGRNMTIAEAEDALFADKEYMREYM